MLAENEVILSKLYRTYADQYPNHEFRVHISDEELIHSEWIRSLYLKVRDHIAVFDRKRFPTAALKTFHDYVEKQIAVTEIRFQTLTEALTISLNIEQSLIEKKFFQVFEPAPKEIKKVLDDLEAETLEHAVWLQAEIDKVNEN